jgi:hypothetical protein
VIVEVLHCLSNITAGTTDQKESVSAAGLFAPVREILQEGDYKAKKEACHVLRNAVDRDATPEHFMYVASILSVPALPMGISLSCYLSFFIFWVSILGTSLVLKARYSNL